MEKTTENGGTLNYGKFIDLLDVVLKMQGRSMFSLSDIRDVITRNRGKCTRRTAERIRDALLRALPDMEELDFRNEKNEKVWRIDSLPLKTSLRLNLAELEAMKIAQKLLGAEGCENPLESMRRTETNIGAVLMAKNQNALKKDAEELNEQIAVAWRPRVSKRFDKNVEDTLRRAIADRRRVDITFVENGHAENAEICPYGIILTADAHYVVHHRKKLTEDRRETVLYDMASITRAAPCDKIFYNDEDFDIGSFAEQTFGVCAEKPFAVELRFKPGIVPYARKIDFHPTQEKIENGDGSLTVKFQAAGVLEMSWFLLRFGKSVEVIAPADFYRRAAKAQQEFENGGFCRPVVKGVA